MTGTARGSGSAAGGPGTGGSGAGLPDGVPAAPWRCRFRGVLWWCRADRTARALVADAVPAGARRGVVTVLTVGAVVEYVASPVGPYSEVLGAVVLLGAGRARVHVPFLGVDSAASMAGGRRNWALPKVPALIEGAPGSAAGVTASGGGSWKVTAGVSRRGPAVPAPLVTSLIQVGQDGGPLVASLRGLALARPARVVVGVEADPGLARWFPAGNCWGAVLDRGSFFLGPASPLGEGSR